MVNCDEKYGYVYFIRNKVTHQFYIGARFVTIREKILPEDDLWNRYFTSSTYVHDLIDQYGKDSFDFQILFVSNDINEIFSYEQNEIRINKDNEFLLNKHWFSAGSKVFISNEERIIKLKKTVANFSIEKKNEISKKLSLIRKGKNLSENHKKKIALSNKGRKVSIESIIKRNITFNSIPKVTCPHCNKTGQRSIMYYHHFDNCPNKSGNIRKKVICPHCDKEGEVMGMGRWHFNNCKKKKNLYDE